MSGITPILDTLLHQVLGKRVDTPVAKDLPEPVSAKSSSDAIQGSRSDSRLHQEAQNRLVNVAPTKGDAPPLGNSVARSDPPPASAQTHLSRTAVDIATLLAKFPSPSGAMPPARAALLNQMPTQATTLAGALKDGIASSGAFYESHLLRWSQGRLPVQALWREPQAWLSLTFRPLPSMPAPLAPHANAWLQSRQQPDARGESSRLANPSPGGRAMLLDLPVNPVSSRPQGRASAPFLAPTDMSMPKAIETAMSTLERTSTVRAHQLSTQSAPESLQTIVRHQLELLVSPQIQWSGELWPGAPVTIELLPLVESDEEEGAQFEDDQESASRWRARVRMTLPELGDITIVLENAGRDWQIDILPNSVEAVAPLQRSVDELSSRFHRADIEANIRLRTDEVSND
ncbi:flagellar hook-length control protein FliK [Salinicola aestuarinus]|uniref:flagellar hook-length control protein FliK n=1 Tax=Salinicola aestuarinus TaxID=1949082 RepID=UPI000DA17B9B|nr:flagellar hook-length control protein FliK [Salinicola aestuarinus]